MNTISPTAFVLCYTIKTKNDENFVDHWEIFHEYNENKESPEQQAEKRIAELIESHDCSGSDSEVYTWNIAKLTKTSDHYQTDPKPTIEEYTEIIQKAYWFIVQIPHDIIDRAWPVKEELVMNKHFEAKYRGYCSKDGYASANAVISFFCDLDSTNKPIFCREIAKYIHDKNLLFD